MMLNLFFIFLFFFMAQNFAFYYFSIHSCKIFGSDCICTTNFISHYHDLLITYFQKQMVISILYKMKVP